MPFDSTFARVDSSSGNIIDVASEKNSEVFGNRRQVARPRQKSRLRKNPDWTWAKFHTLPRQKSRLRRLQGSLDKISESFTVNSMTTVQTKKRLLIRVSSAKAAKLRNSRAGQISSSNLEASLSFDRELK